MVRLRIPRIQLHLLYWVTGRVPVSMKMECLRQPAELESAVSWDLFLASKEIIHVHVDVGCCSRLLYLICVIGTLHVY